MNRIQFTAKAIIILVVLVGLFTLMALGRMAWDDVEVIVTAVVFYAIGNGIAAVKGKPIASAIESRDVAHLVEEGDL